ncbi:MAG: aryl-sulfate sulfotransferase [Saprospiraceae bacterium]|nr:aryl-sulfate sulfotransferase [Saprospiraceae bacterium]
MVRSLFLVLTLLSSLSIQAQTIGLFQNDSLSFNGYTLFTPSTGSKAYLIDNCGELINSWDTNYFPGLDVELLPDGRLARAARWNGSFNGGGVGGRIEIYNWEGDLEWGYIYANELVHQHHDFEILPNGNVLILAWEDKTDQEAINEGRIPASIGQNGVWPDHLVEVEPFGINQGTIVWEWHIWDHLVQDYDPTKENYGVVADHPELINVNYAVSTGSADWNHCNAIDYVEAFDQIVISSRNFDEFWVIDHSTTTAEAAGHTGGQSGKGGDILYRWGNPAAYNRGTINDKKLFGQHHVHYIEDGSPDAGKIIYYNNGTGRPDGLYSTVEILDPPVDSEGNYTLNGDAPYGPENVYWIYGSGGANQFFSQNVSGATQMPNGNVLICVGNPGRFFEVTLSGEKVWEYINPVEYDAPAEQGSNVAQNTVFRTYRYAPDFPAFDGKDLTPMGPLELNPLPSDCMIYEEEMMAATATPHFLEDVKLLTNPVSDELALVNPAGRLLNTEILDLTGKLLFSGISSDQLVTFNVNTLGSGMYILRVTDKQKNLFTLIKLIKT